MSGMEGDEEHFCEGRFGGNCLRKRGRRMESIISDEQIIFVSSFLRLLFLSTGYDWWSCKSYWGKCLLNHLDGFRLGVLMAPSVFNCYILPHLNNMQSITTLKRRFSSVFRGKIYNSNDWLCGCEVRHFLFCFPYPISCPVAKSRGYKWESRISYPILLENQPRTATYLNYPFSLKRWVSPHHGDYRRYQ